MAPDAYALFGIPAEFEIDTADLESRWKRLLQAVHPDRHASADDAQKRAATQMATRVNDAYRLLKNPVERARLLLLQAGCAVDEVSASRGLPIDLLEQQMDWRERLEEQPEQARGAIRAEVEAALHEATLAFRAHSAESQWFQAQQSWSTMLFLQRFSEDLR